MTVIASETAGAEIPREYPPRAAVISWIFFDWAAQPYFTLITTFVFAPYFAGFVAPDPAQGQALWGFATAAAGLMIALLSPVLGAIADASGRRKPWIAGFGALLVIGASLMWFGKPGDPSVIPALLLAYSIASVGVEFATVFNNAMMPTLVPPDRIGRLSGTGGLPAISAASSASFWCSAFWPRTPIPGGRFSAWHRCSVSTWSATRAIGSPVR